MTASSKSPLKGKDKKKSGFNGSIDGIDFTDFPLQNQTNNFNKDTKKSLSGSSAMLPPLFHRLGEIGVRNKSKIHFESKSQHGSGARR